MGTLEAHANFKLMTVLQILAEHTELALTQLHLTRAFVSPLGPVLIATHLKALRSPSVMKANFIQIQSTAYRLTTAQASSQEIIDQAWIQKIRACMVESALM